jgi:hypothetical protein
MSQSTKQLVKYYIDKNPGVPKVEAASFISAATHDYRLIRTRGRIS